MSICTQCHSTDAELFRGDDDRHRIRCHSCGYEWGPFTSSQTMKRREEAQSQPSLVAYAGGNGNETGGADR